MVFFPFAETTSTDVDLPAANALKANFSYDIVYETVEGIKTPRVVKPDVSIGGLEFRLFARNRQEEKPPYTLFMELSEASKKTLLDGYEIKFTKFSTNDVHENGRKARGQGRIRLVLPMVLLSFTISSPRSIAMRML